MKFKDPRMLNNKGDEQRQKDRLIDGDSNNNVEEELVDPESLNTERLRKFLTKSTKDSAILKGKENKDTNNQDNPEPRSAVNHTEIINQVGN